LVFKFFLRISRLFAGNYYLIFGQKLTSYGVKCSGVATGVRGAGRTGRHLLGAAKGRKTPKIKEKFT